MARRTRKSALMRAFSRNLRAMTRTTLRAGAKVIQQGLKAQTTTAPRPRPRRPAQRSPDWISGVAVGLSGVRRYRLFKPTGMKRGDRLPLLVMLHGCGQDADELAASSRMNRLAEQARFFVLYPEQDRMANMQGCWNWYATRSGKAQAEAGMIMAAIDTVCRSQPIDAARIAVAGLSAGAGMAALLVVLHAARFRAVVMHSGVAPGAADSPIGAVRAMRGRSAASTPIPRPAGGPPLPPLLVIQGSRDHVVASANGRDAAQRWADQADAKAGVPRQRQRGKRHAATLTDYRCRGRLASTLCEIEKLGHAWSGGAAGRAYSDPEGPDASRMIWTFVSKQFAAAQPQPRP